ncbi:Na(+)/H(+) antiporter NhaA 1 [Agaricicola taiwanensis]|uniref:Na(+)/H(+) antiporter NhaA n=1 Tax=Agaricicola taiwanensis TaxID=591372 RepID=A0A8J2YL32_9RHOB|nr:Na+/H+ antiporter NhaA [Agaricicola taiwanensis]GGE51199.1 Na(+)/H(+) antiporter NhaA 1 [Agaricicola taiwanensis]
MSSLRPAQQSFIRRFIASEATGGIVLMVVAVLALLVANSPLSDAYFAGLHVYVGGLSVLHWINDGLMAVFFLMVGLEIKREALTGQLATWPQRVLPGLAALGGMVAPALAYLIFNAGSPETLRGWAIPAATDIAFALGVLSLLGSRVPLSLKIFLTALAVIDDLGAVVIIALFYTANLNVLALGGAIAVTAVLILMNRRGFHNLAPYLLLGLVLWFLVLMSGIHATLAGVVLALTIPLAVDPRLGDSSLIRLEHAIHPWVAFLIVPIFGFANAGVSFAGFTPSVLLQPVPLGIAAGLFLGKQVGIFTVAVLSIRLGLARLPEGASWRQVYGVALLCGIGFTMSLFIGLLAFPASPGLQDEVKIGVMMGSLLSGVVGALVLVAAPARKLAPVRG